MKRNFKESKMKPEVISLRNANKLFPDKWSKMRVHDMTGKLVNKNKFLSPSERVKVDKLLGRLRENNQDFFVTRKGRKLTIEPMFDDE